MSTFFRNKQTINYKFHPDYYSQFQNISMYSEIIDSVKDNISFYEYYNILEGERADHVSYKLYGTVDYYWTFFLMNDHIRYNGWPLHAASMKDKIKNEYSNYVITGEESIIGSFFEGQEVKGSVTDETATIINKNFQLNQIFLDSKNFEGEKVLTYMDSDDKLHKLNVKSAVPLADAVHHYETTDGEFIDPHQLSEYPSEVVTMTYKEKIKKENSENKRIKVIRPQAINTIVSAYNRSMKY